MSDPVYMDFDEPEHPFDSAPNSRARKKKEKKQGIPRLPKPKPPLTGDEVRRGVSERSRSAANLKVEGYSYAEIADLLEYETPQDAERAVTGVLASIHGSDDYETLRLIVTARAEQQFKRSAAMAGADYLVLKDGTKVPNADKIRWHREASNDLMNYALITGTKAPTRVEITPGEADMERIASEILRRQGIEDIVDAEVIELDQIPAITAGDDDAETA